MLPMVVMVFLSARPKSYLIWLGDYFPIYYTVNALP